LSNVHIRAFGSGQYTRRPVKRKPSRPLNFAAVKKIQRHALALSRAATIDSVTASIGAIPSTRTSFPFAS
jgi:hypothetical protein